MIREDTVCYLLDEAFLDIEAYFSELLTSKWQTGSQVIQEDIEAYFSELLTSKWQTGSQVIQEDIEAYFLKLLTSKWPTGSQVIQRVIVLKNNPCSPVLKNVGCQKDFIQLFSVLFIFSISEIYITIHITVYGTVLYIK